MIEKNTPFQPAEQRLFFQSSKLQTMRPAPIRVEWKPFAVDAQASVRAELVSSINFTLLDEIFENFLEVTGLLIAVIDQEGKVLSSSKWQRLCIEFHRANPQTRSRCVMSDTVLSQQMQAGTDYAVYRCANGLIDCATPIIIEGVHVANLFTGQFLLDAPDKDYFLQQQEMFGFDKDAYFKALSEIPILSERKIPAVIKLLKGLAQQIARQSLSEKRALCALADVETQVAARTREVQEGEQHFRALFEGSPVGQLIIDPATLRILECNQAAADTYGYAIEELQRLRIVDLDTVLDDQAQEAVRQEIKAKGRIRFETRIRRKNGEQRHLIVTLVLLRSAQGDRFHATQIDITDQRQARHAQEKASRALRLLTECNNALLHADDEQKLLNDICRLITDTGGYPMAWVGIAEQDTGKSVRSVAQSGPAEAYLQSIRLTWDDTELGRGPTGTAIRTGVTQVNQNSLENPRMAPWRDAAVKYGYQASIALPLPGAHGVLGALTVYAKEADGFVAEEVELLEKLGQNLAFGIEALRARIRLANANKELQSFTYAASHDLKGPLGRIAIFSMLLEQRYRDRLDGDGRQSLDFIRQNAIRLTLLVEALLAHSQVEQQPANLLPIDLPAIVQDVLDEQSNDIQEMGAEVRIELPPALVQASRQSLVQALRNLLANALKYSSRAQRPIIEMGGERQGNRYRMWIRDNGVGFDMTYHDRIFEMFRRLHTYDEYPGNGVGLALVKKAMESMGGRVWAESQPGQGATFFLEFKAPPSSTPPA